MEEDLRCCGNCKRTINDDYFTVCKEKQERVNSFECCKSWEFDGLSYNERVED